MVVLLVIVFVFGKISMMDGELPSLGGHLVRMSLGRCSLAAEEF